MCLLCVCAPSLPVAMVKTVAFSTAGSTKNDRKLFSTFIMIHYSSTGTAVVYSVQSTGIRYLPAAATSRSLKLFIVTLMYCIIRKETFNVPTTKNLVPTNHIPRFPTAPFVIFASTLLDVAHLCVRACVVCSSHLFWRLSTKSCMHHSVDDP